MPATEPRPGAAPAGPPPAMHPMDPARGENLSPAFAALLSFLIARPAMTEPAITGVVMTGGCVFAATTDDCLHNALIGSWADVEGNLRAWGAVTETPAAIVDGLVDKVRRASQ